MIEFYLDSVDVAAISRLHRCIPIKGVTSNPSILSSANTGVELALTEISHLLGKTARFHIQVVSTSVDDMVAEAVQLASMPYDIVVKIPATETGLAAIKQIKQQDIAVLATAIYSSQQGFMAAIAGADYLAPYVNRMDSMGGDGISVVAELQHLLDVYGLDCRLLPASFKNTRQVIEVLKLGVAAITLPVDIADQMLLNPAVEPAIDRFTQDWQNTFGTMLSYQT